MNKIVLNTLLILAGAMALGLTVSAITTASWVTVYFIGGMFTGMVVSVILHEKVFPTPREDRDELGWLIVDNAR